MRFNNRLYNSIKFAFLSLKYSIIIINSYNRLVSRHFNNIHVIDFTEFLLFCKSCTCHTSLLLKLIKEVLECNSCKSLTLSLNLNMLFGFYRLMKTI